MGSAEFFLCDTPWNSFCTTSWKRRVAASADPPRHHPSLRSSFFFVTPSSVKMSLLCCQSQWGSLKKYFPRNEQFWFHFWGARGNDLWWCQLTPPRPKWLNLLAVFLQFYVWSGVALLTACLRFLVRNAVSYLPYDCACDSSTFSCCRSRMHAAPRRFDEAVKASTFRANIVSFDALANFPLRLVPNEVIMCMTRSCINYKAYKMMPKSWKKHQVQRTDRGV